MVRMRVTVAIAAIAAAAFSILPGAARAEPSASFNDAARFIAGLPPSAGSPLNTYTNDAFWKQYAHNFDDAWDGLDKRQLMKIRTLVSRDFNNPKPVLFYLFSGPDFLYGDAFFPSADTYVMAGLEPPGQIPDLRKYSRGELAGALRDLRASLSSVLSYSFFQTKFMRVDFSRAKLNGTVPVLMTFLARSGKTIYDISLFDLQNDGTLHPVEEKIANPTGRGVQITFSDANVGKKRTLYYFSTDLSDSGIKSSGFLTFCDKLGHGDAFVKSASYLMHSDNFSTVRDYLLSHSASILRRQFRHPGAFLRSRLAASSLWPLRRTDQPVWRPVPVEAQRSFCQGQDDTDRLQPRLPVEADGVEYPACRQRRHRDGF